MWGPRQGEGSLEPLRLLLACTDGRIVRDHITDELLLGGDVRSDFLRGSSQGFFEV